MGHRENEIIRDLKPTPEGERLGNQVIRKVCIGSAALLIVLGLGCLLYVSM